METNTTIPLFESNQILSSSHLNQLRQYLDNEIRYSRIKLSGVGIVCGMHIKSATSTAIVISAGYGITTDGHLLDFPGGVNGADVSYSFFLPYVDPMLPAYAFGKELATDSNWDQSGNPPTSVEAENATPNFKLFELFQTKDTEYKTEAIPLNQFDTKSKSAKKFKDMAVVYYCEFDDADLKNCTGANCDNKGKKRLVALRMLLVDPALLTQYDSASTLKISDPLVEINIPRLEDAQLATINSLATLRTAYNGKIIQTQAAVIKMQLINVWNAYSYLLALSDKHIPEANAVLNAFATGSTSVKYIQYAADLLKDVTQTYNEFADAAYAFFVSCGKTILPFPKHLTLGIVGGAHAPSDYDVYRTVFFNVPPFDAQDHHLFQARALFKKMLLLLVDFQEPAEARLLENKVGITPDGSDVQAFSERTIPYYYDSSKLETDLFPVWNPKKTVSGKEKNQLGYFAGAKSTQDYFNNPLKYSVLKYPLLRTEAIAGKNAVSVRNSILALCNTYNLPMKVKLLRLEDTTPDLNETDPCAFNDIAADYLLVRSEMICCVKEMQEILGKTYSFLITNRIDKAIEKIRTEKPDQYNKDFIYIGGNWAVPPDTIGNQRVILELAKYVSQIASKSGPFVAEILKSLPEIAVDFEYAKFIFNYKQYDLLAVQFYTFLERLIVLNEHFLQETEMTVLQEKQFAEARELVNRLKWLGCQCIYPKLGILESIYRDRKAAIKDSTLFRNFVSRQKGLEHYAGAPWNGTLFLVYSSIKIYPSGEPNQIVADFALPDSLCCDSCVPMSRKLSQPYVAVNDAVVVSPKEIASSVDEFPIDIFSNDYRLNETDRPIGAVKIELVEAKNSYKNMGSLFVRNGRTGDEVFYQSNNKFVPTIDFFLIKITDAETGFVDYSTITVVIREIAPYLIHTEPDTASVLVGTKVEIYVLINDESPIIDKGDIEVVFTEENGDQLKALPYLSQAGNELTTFVDRNDGIIKVLFDSGNTSKTIKDTVTDRFYYVVKDKQGNYSLPTPVDVYIIPCCANNQIVFELPHHEYCTNGNPEAFIIDAPQYPIESLVVTGPGVKGGVGSYTFNPSDSRILPGTLTFVLSVDDGNMTPIGDFTITLNEPAGADFTVTPPQEIVGFALCIAADRSGDLYEWFVLGLQVGQGPIFNTQYYRNFQYTVLLRVRKFYGTDSFCTSEMEHQVGEGIRFAAVDGFNAAKTVDSGLKETNTFVRSKTFTTEADKSDTDLAVRLRDVVANLKEAVVNPQKTSELISGSLDNTIIEAANSLVKMDRITDTIKDPKMIAGAESSTASIGISTMLALALRSDKLPVDVAITESVTKVSERLAALADKNAAAFTANDKKVLDQAFEMAAGNTLLRDAINVVRTKLEK
jgi:hypothetical protein